MLDRLPNHLKELVVAEAQVRKTQPDDLIVEFVANGLTLNGLGGHGRIQTEMLLHDRAVALTYPSRQVPNGDGYVDSLSEENELKELRQLLEPLKAPPSHFSHRFLDIGRGAQGDPWTWVEVAQTFTLLFGAIASPAAAIVAWQKAISPIQTWLKRRRGRASLGFVKACCIEHASELVPREQIDSSLVSGHAGQAAYDGTIAELHDDALVGPYCVTIYIPSRRLSLVYITDEVGTIIHHHEVPGGPS